MRSNVSSGSKLLAQRSGVSSQACGVDAVRRLTTGHEAGRRATKQGDRTRHVAPLDVGDTHRELGQRFPQVPLAVRAGLPGRLEHIVGVKREALVQESLGVGQRIVRRQLEVLGDSGDTGAPVREWAAQRIARSVVAGAAGFVAVTGSHLSILASKADCFTPTPRRPPPAVSPTSMTAI